MKNLRLFFTTAVFFLVPLFVFFGACTPPDREPSNTPNATVNVSDPNCEHDAKTLRCVKYIRNYDADTITVSVKGVHPLLGEKIGVRVRGIDSPEIKGKQPCEKESARTAKRLIENLLKNAKRIDLENLDRDKYFRILADVKVDSVSLKDLLLKNDLAYAYDGGTKAHRNWCQRKPAGM